uniref:Uncharacterized protein n=1 Tax=Musca domestica TaxID=7370 RepID=T1PKI8_MUSDO
MFLRVSENLKPQKPVESLSDDFLFPMTSNRLSYASSPESDLELSPGPSTSLSLGNLPQLVKSNSDPSIATNQDNLDRDRDIIGEGLPPPYTIPFDHSNTTTTTQPPPSRRQTMDTSKYGGYSSNSNLLNSSDPSTPSTRPQSLYGINAPDLPPRIDRQSKPGPNDIVVTPSSTNTPSRSNSSGGTLGRSAQERLFGKAIVSDDVQAEYISRNAANALQANQPPPTGADPTTMDRHHASLERQARLNAAAQSKIPGAPTSATASAISTPQQQNGSSYDSVSSYDSYNASQLTMQNLGRLGPNAPDDLKSVPNVNAGRPLPPVGMAGQTADYARTTHDHRQYGGGPNDLNRQSSPGRPPYHDMNAARNIDPRNGTPQRPSNLGLEGSPRKVETKTDYGKYRYHFHIHPFHIHCPTALQRIAPAGHGGLATTKSPCSAMPSCMPSKITWRNCNRPTAAYVMNNTGYAPVPAQFCSVSRRRPIVQNISIYDTLV